MERETRIGVYSKGMLTTRLTVYRYWIQIFLNDKQNYRIEKLVETLIIK